MVPCTSWRWLPMVVRIWAKMQLELRLAQAIVMRSAPMISNSSTERPIPRIGGHIPKISATVWAWVITVLAVLRWIFGRRTIWRQLILPIHATLRHQGNTCVKVLSVETMTKMSVMMVCVTRTVVTSTPSATATAASTARGPNSPWIRPSPWRWWLSSWRSTARIMATYRRFEGSTCSQVVVSIQFCFWRICSWMFARYCVQMNILTYLYLYI